MNAKIEIEDNSEETKNAMELAVTVALTKCGLKAERYAKQLCIVDTGLLRNSIMFALNGESANIATYISRDGSKTGEYNGTADDDEKCVFIGTNVEYAPYVELGTGVNTPGGRQDAWAYKDDKGNWHRTHGMKPHPFIKPAVADHADEGDYLQILVALGKECLGALKVTDTAAQEDIPCAYEKLSLEQVRAVAQEGATKSAELVAKSHLSLAGASGKVGLYYDEAQQQWYLPIGSAPSTHIVKQSHVCLNAIVTNEQLSILTAKKLGIAVPDSFIINTGSFGDGDVLFATKRYDRVWSSASKTAGGLPMPLRLHQEVSGRLWASLPQPNMSVRANIIFGICSACCAVFLLTPSPTS